MGSAFGLVLNDLLDEEALSDEEMYEFWLHFYRLGGFDDPELERREESEAGLS